jgi:hypothetical protein
MLVEKSQTEKYYGTSMQKKASLKLGRQPNLSLKSEWCGEYMQYCRYSSRDSRGDISAMHKQEQIVCKLDRLCADMSEVSACKWQTGR